MPKIVMSNDFLELEEGKDQVLLISKVTYNSDYEKITLTFVDRYGRSSRKPFVLGKENASRSTAKSILSVIAKAATRDYKSKAIDMFALEGKFIMADVAREPGKSDPNRLFANLSNYRPTDETFVPVKIDDDYDDLYIIDDDEELEEVSDTSEESSNDETIFDDDELFS